MKYCKRQGFKRSAEIADQIDRVLCYIYGDVNTQAWVKFVREDMDLSIRGLADRIVRSSAFCIACEVDGEQGGGDCYLCGHCRFNELAGRDGDTLPLYEEFVDTLKEESEL